VTELRAVIFDLDGTLIDSYEAIAESLNAARSAFNLPPLVTDTVRAAVGHGLENLIEHWVGPDRIQQGVRLFRERYARICRQKTELLPGVTEGLQRLDMAGISSSIASNKPARFSKLLLEHLGIASYFVSVHGPDTVRHAKPDPAMLERCLLDLGVRAEESLYVGDMPLDAESGKNAGVTVRLVSTGSTPSIELQKIGVPVYSGFTELVDAIRREPCCAD
jgi:phosphoglycolate phosphatase